ncbi:hypothetical protein FD21_GL001391 [Liquorilactobacillus vini DSM 20605]|uniref:Uncharacterized protein n=1 Tax=Liquorilactobacillus vini DSM 20605 TaxID=1133569 RepID=A0A0R2CCK5_9LACO|nr:hypothetical protein FD21_GL001391 [Liquorilactobacillus vini DSM 20605]
MINRFSAATALCLIFEQLLISQFLLIYQNFTAILLKNQFDNKKDRISELDVLTIF